MPKNESRGAVVSLRLSAEEQDRLRTFAEARHSSVSEFIRTVVEREVNPRPSGSTVTGSMPNTTPGTRSVGPTFSQIGQGASFTTSGASGSTERTLIVKNT